MPEISRIIKDLYVRFGLPGTSLDAGLRDLLKKNGQVHEREPRLHVDIATARLAEENEEALSRRPFLDPNYKFRPVSTHDKRFQELKRTYPYFGYINVEIEGVRPFVMFSNNDDRVAQTYFWYGPNAFESMSLRIWCELVRRSSYVFDIGAFTGVYSLAAARANRDAGIHSFEPIKRVLGRLVINLAANRSGQRVKEFNVALGDTDGEIEMNLFQGNRTLSSGSSLLEKGDKEIVARERVETARFDTFVEKQAIPGVDLIKIDVERAEKMVVSGMTRTLRDHRPHLIVEVLDGNLQALIDVLSPHGYNFAVIDDLAQSIAVNDARIPRSTSNVLFSAMPPAEFEGLCRSLKPL